MEKGTVLKNVNNGKVGTVVQYQEKFGHVILEVEGKNVDYNVSTIKRWWKPVKDITPEQDNLVAMPGIELDPVEGRERGKAQSCKKETPVKQNKPETTFTSGPQASKKLANVAPKQAEEKPKSKKSDSPKTSKGLDAKVFSYIKEVVKGKFNLAEKHGFIVVTNSKKRVMEIRLTSKHITIHALPVSVPKKLVESHSTIKGTALSESYILAYDNYKETLPKFISIFETL